MENISYVHIKKKTKALIPQKKRVSYYLITVLSLLLFILAFFTKGFPAEISDIEVSLINKDIYVSASLKPDSNFINSLNEGMTKELVFFIDLFRVWNIWPDEFITGKKIVRILKSDPIKREYSALNIDGNLQIEKRFKNVESMIEWALKISDLRLLNFRELDKGAYFVKVTVESRIRKLPPLIGFIFFFLPEREFSISRQSKSFQLN